MGQLYLIRHGETSWNTERRLQGHVDRPLSERGRDQARRLRAEISLIQFNSILSSDLRRASETADLAGFPNADASAEWREMDLGAWSGRLIPDILNSSPNEYGEWRSGLGAPPGGETWDAFEKRIAHRLSIVQKSSCRTLLVTHSGVIRMIMKLLFGLMPGKLPPAGHASMTIIGLGHSPRLIAYDHRLNSDANEPTSE